MNDKKIAILERALTRERAARKQAELILEKKSADLFGLTQQLKVSNTKLEELLTEKTSQIQEVFENIIDAYVVMDLKGNILKMNDAAVDLFGYESNTTSLNVIKLIYKEDFEYAMLSYKELIKNGFFSNYKARIYTKNKKIKWVQINASLILNEHKKPIAAQGIVRDITEAENAATIIKEQKRELEIIVDNSSFGIILTQFGNIVKSNEAFQNLLGYSESEMKSLTIKDVSFAKDFPELQRYLSKLDAGEIDDFIINKRYRKKNGDYFWSKTSVNAVRDQEGNIKCQVAIIEDITARRDEKLTIEMVNNVAKSILGKTDINEIAWELTSNISEYLGSDDCVIYIVDYNTNSLEQIAAHGEKLTGEKEVLNRISLPLGSGIVGRVANTGIGEVISDTSLDEHYIVDDRRRYSEITVPIVFNGKVLGVIDSEHYDKSYFTKAHLKTLTNIAQLVALQLRNAINLIEREKTEAQNRQLLKKLEISNNELEEYAHIVSHDLKSPLRSIYALVDWIKEDNEDLFNKETTQNIGLIESTLEKMEQLIIDVLEYSSVTSERTVSEAVDLNDVLSDIHQILYFPDHIKLSLKKKLPIINADRVRVQQLFQNLIGNAIRYIDKDKGLIEIDVEDKNLYYLFSITDNGVGIEKKFHEKIFKIFQSLKKGKVSSGIGLSIVKKIVDLYDGRIWLESVVGQGTTFYFTLRKQK